MSFHQTKKYILYAKKHNLFVRGNKALGVDTTEVQLTTDGVENFSYAKEAPEGMMERLVLMHVGVRIVGTSTLYLKMNENFGIFG